MSWGKKSDGSRTARNMIIHKHTACCCFMLIYSVTLNFGKNFCNTIRDPEIQKNEIMSHHDESGAARAQKSKTELPYPFFFTISSSAWLFTLNTSYINKIIIRIPRGATNFSFFQKPNFYASNNLRGNICHGFKTQFGRNFKWKVVRWRLKSACNLSSLHFTEFRANCKSEATTVKMN
jgi:hypothetical protein